SGLDNRITVLRDNAVATTHDVRLENMVVAHDVLDTIGLDERAECAAAAVAVGEVFAPAAGSSQLNRRRLFCRMGNESDKFVGGFDLDVNTVNFGRESLNDFGHRAVSVVHVHDEGSAAGIVQANCGAEHRRKLHHFMRHLMLQRHDSFGVGMVEVEQGLRTRSGECHDRGYGRESEAKNGSSQFAYELVTSHEELMFSLCMNWRRHTSAARREPRAS